MVDWGTILANKQSINVIKDFATDKSCAKRTSSNLQNPDAKREFNSAVKMHKTAYTRRLARKALRRRGVNV